MTRRPCIAITLGDPCGIGPELLLGSLHAINRWADVVVVGARAGVDLLGARAGPASAGAGAAPSGRSRPAPRGWRTMASGPPTRTGPGRPGSPTGSTPPRRSASGQLTLGGGSAASGRCAVEAVRAGAALAQSGWADALVTLPLAKSAAHLAGYPIPGHTEFLQGLCGSPISRMAFVSPRLVGGAGHRAPEPALGGGGPERRARGPRPSASPPTGSWGSPASPGCGSPCAP